MVSLSKYIDKQKFFADVCQYSEDETFNYFYR
jgi:hypothetical protein